MKIQHHKLMAFKEIGGGGPFRNPVMEYAVGGGMQYAIRAQWFDTSLPFGNLSLDELAQSFLGVGKLHEISDADKHEMERCFREKPETAFTYAIVDAVLTLLVEERMHVEHRGMYEKLGFHTDDIPTLRPTLGGASPK